MPSYGAAFPWKAGRLKGSMRMLPTVLCWALAAFLVWQGLQSSMRGFATGLLALAAGAAFVAGVVILRWDRQG
jgi:hypothetical protein